MQFHLDAHIVLKRATQLALGQQAAEVGLEHLLSCQPDQEPSESYLLKDIPFSRDVLQVLESAAEFAQLEGDRVLKRRFLELAIMRKTGRIPDWGPIPAGQLVSDLLDDHTARVLQDCGIDVKQLRLDLGGLTLAECRPEPPFYTSPAGQEYLSTVKFLAEKENATGLLAFLGYLLCGGPACKILTRSGLTRVLIVKVLEGSWRRSADSPTSSPAEIRRFFETHGLPVDFGDCLGTGLERLNPECRQALKLAWNSRKRPELDGRDLLRGLIANSDPQDSKSVLSLLLSLSPAGKLPVDLIHLELCRKVEIPTLTPDFYRVLAVAFEEPGPITPHRLLKALATNGHLPGVTPDLLP